MTNLEAKLNEMAVAAVVTNQQVKQLREKYESILANADTDEECGRDDMAEYRRNYAQGMYQACKMMGIEL